MYRYSIKKDSNTYYAIVNGSVDTQNTPYYFYEGIANFSEQGIKVKRNIMRGGFTTTYMENEYQFTNPEGDVRNHMKKVIKHIFLTHGPDASATLVVELLTDYQNKTWSVDYECALNFATALFDRDFISVPLFEGGISDKMVSRSGTKYTIPITSTNQKRVLCKAIRLYGRSQYLTFHQAATAGNDTQGNQAGALNFWPSIQQYHEEYVEVNDSQNLRPIDYSDEIPARLYIKGQQILQNSTGWASGAYQNFLFRTNVALENVRIQLTLPSFIKNNSGSNTLTIKADVMIWQEGAAAGTETVHTDINGNLMRYSQTTYAASGQGNHTFTIDGTCDVPAGYRIYLVITADQDDYEWNWEKDKKLEISYEYFSSEFEVKGISLYDAAAEIVKQVTDNTGTFTSDLLTRDISYSEGLDCKPKNIILVSGDSIRGVENPTIKLSWNDIIRAVDLWFCAGWDVVGSTVLIEKRSHFMREASNNLIADLGEVIDYEVSHTADMGYNEIHIGYPEQEYDNLNGKQEFNTTLKMLAGVNRVQVGGSEEVDTAEVKEVISTIRTDTFGLYSLWQKYSLQNDTETDNIEDNSVFALQHKPTPVSGVYGALYPSDISSGYIVQGVQDPNLMLNTGLTPKTCLKRRTYWEISHFYDSDLFTSVYNLDYLTVDKNAAFRKQIATSFFISEAADEDMALNLVQLGQSRLFHPYYLTVTVKAPDNFRALWAANRYGYFTVDIEGVRYKGFPIEAAEKNTVPKTHTYKLLLTGGDSPLRLR